MARDSDGWSSPATAPYDPYIPQQDVTEVRLLGAYAARRCPVRTQLQFDPPDQAPLALPSVALQRRLDEGLEFERTVTASFGDAVRISGRCSHDETTATVQAMEAGASIIIGGALPDDLRGRRTGKPDILVRAMGSTSTLNKPAYWPVDIKNHGCLQSDKALPVFVSPIDAPFVETGAIADQRFDGNDKTRRSDLVQLAHYWRMLQACGHAASGDGPVWGGIIGNDSVGVAWADLSLPRFRTAGSSYRDATESALRRYDFEFAFRLDIAATAELHRADPSVPLLADPMSCTECAGCEWRDHCGPTLAGNSGDVSLLPRVGYKQWSALRRAGFRLRSDVASIDLKTARVVDAFPNDMSLAEALAAARRHEASTPVKAVVGRKATRQLRVLDACGIETAGDLTALDVGVCALHGEVHNLAELVDVAWIGVHGGGQPRRRRGVGSTAIPRADVEVDIDMENDFDGGTYLWGTLLTNRSNGGFAEPEGYRPFVQWGSVTAGLEAAIFEAFLDWLLGVIRSAQEAGLTIKVYSWHGAAEIGKLRRAAPMTDDPQRRGAEIRSLVGAAEVWVDLEREFNTVAVGANGSRLKKVAPFAGTSWDAEDAGGDLSMVWHESAVRGDVEARARLLRYNEDDVRACVSIREWLCADELPALPDAAIGDF